MMVKHESDILTVCWATSDHILGFIQTDLNAEHKTIGMDENMIQT